MGRRSARLILAGCAWALPAWAAPELACPAELRVHASAETVPGWRAVVPAEDRLPLERMEIRTAPEQPDTVPQTGYLRMEQGGRKTIVARWDLTEARSGFPVLWLACHYAGTTIVLTRQLPEEADRCEYRVESSEARLRETASCR